MTTSAQRSAAPLQRMHLHGPTMGTRWAVTCDAPAHTERSALQAALQACVDRLDAQMSPWQAGSDLLRLNRAPLQTWVDLPAEMLQVLHCALEVCALSQGAFDPAVGALVDAWGFGAARDAPDAQAIAAARTGPHPLTAQTLDIDLAAGRVRKRAALQLDLCGIAKGYGVDSLAGVLHQHGITHALVALDGELRALGSQADASPWPVALERPQAGLRAVHSVLELQDMAVATSGDYRRFFDLGGARLAHSMDARTRQPVRNDVASVTVLAPRCMHADAWATALLVAGPGAGLALAQKHGMDALWLLRRADGLVALGCGQFANG